MGGRSPRNRAAGATPESHRRPRRSTGYRPCHQRSGKPRRSSRRLPCCTVQPVTVPGRPGASGRSSSSRRRPHGLRLALGDDLHPAVGQVAGEPDQAELERPGADPPAEPHTLDPALDEDRGALHGRRSYGPARGPGQAVPDRSPRARRAASPRVWSRDRLRPDHPPGPLGHPRSRRHRLLPGRGHRPHRRPRRRRRGRARRRPRRGVRAPVRRAAQLRQLRRAVRRRRGRRRLRRHHAPVPPGAGPRRDRGGQAGARGEAADPRRRAGPARSSPLPPQAGVFAMEAMWMRTNPLVRQALDLVAGGELGDGARRPGGLRLRPRLRPRAPAAGPRERRRSPARPRHLPRDVRVAVPGRPRPGPGQRRPGADRRRPDGGDAVVPRGRGASPSCSAPRPSRRPAGPPSPGHGAG